jgi:hypothetical protein
MRIALLFYYLEFLVANIVLASSNFLNSINIFIYMKLAYDILSPENVNLSIYRQETIL